MEYFLRINTTVRRLIRSGLSIGQEFRRGATIWMMCDEGIWAVLFSFSLYSSYTKKVIRTNSSSSLLILFCSQSFHPSTRYKDSNTFVEKSNYQFSSHRQTDCCGYSGLPHTKGMRPLYRSDRIKLLL